MTTSTAENLPENPPPPTVSETYRDLDLGLSGPEPLPECFLENFFERSLGSLPAETRDKLTETDTLNLKKAFLKESRGSHWFDLFLFMLNGNSLAVKMVEDFLRFSPEEDLNYYIRHPAVLRTGFAGFVTAELNRRAHLGIYAVTADPSGQVSCTYTPREHTQEPYTICLFEKIEETPTTAYSVDMLNKAEHDSTMLVGFMGLIEDGESVADSEYVRLTQNALSLALKVMTAHAENGIPLHKDLAERIRKLVQRYVNGYAAWAGDERDKLSGVNPLGLVTPNQPNPDISEGVRQLSEMVDRLTPQRVSRQLTPVLTPEIIQSLRQDMIANPPFGPVLYGGPPFDPNTSGSRTP